MLSVGNLSAQTHKKRTLIVSDKSDYLDFDERADVLSPLELLKLILPVVRETPLLWK